MPRNKETEGDDRQRRKNARKAREAGTSPSAEGATLGASKQRTHKGRHDDHLEKFEAPAKGKQRGSQSAWTEPNPGSGRPESKDTPKKPAPNSARPSERKRRPG